MNDIHQRSDEFIFVAMGCAAGEGELLLSDNQSINLENDLISKFDENNCEALRGKPKVFLIQICNNSGKFYSLWRCRLPYHDGTTGFLYNRILIAVVRRNLR